MKRIKYMLLCFSFIFLFCSVIPMNVQAYSLDQGKEESSSGSGEKVDSLPFEMELGSSSEPGWNLKGTNGTTAPSTQGEAWNHVFKKYRVFIVGVSGAATLTLIAIWIWLFVKLAGSASNPMERQKASKSLLLCGIATALMGSVTTVTALILYVFR